MRARNLQHVLTRFLWSHAELIFGSPVLHLGFRCRRLEAMFYDLCVEADRDLHVAATMQMHLETRTAGMFRDT